MNIKHNVIRHIALSLVFPVLGAAVVNSALAAQPRAASATVSRTGPAGNTSTRQTTASTNGAGGYTAHSTVTGPAGNTATRQASGAYNPSTQTYTRTATTTGPNGKSATSTSSTQLTGNGYVHNTTTIGPNGKSVTSTGQGSYDPATGTASQSRTTTGPNGNSATESRIVTVTPAN